MVTKAKKLKLPKSSAGITKSYKVRIGNKQKKVSKINIVEERNIFKEKRKIKKEFILEGLGCANCSNKMEKKIRELKGVSNASINFVSRTLYMEIEAESRERELIDSIKDIIISIESHVKLKEKSKSILAENQYEHNHVDSEELNKNDLIRLGLGASIFGVACAFNFSEPISTILYFISYVFVGGEVIIRALKNIAKGQVFDENFLMAIATTGAFAIRQYPEAVAVMLFYQVGEFFQNIAVNRSRKSISELMNIRPDFANLKTGLYVKKVSPKELKIGDIIIVKPGERVPLDGRVVEGYSMIDTSALTGESLPREVSAGDSVLSGFVNKNGLLTIKVTKSYGESTVAKILNLVENAGNRKAQTENFITKFARYYTPVVVISAAVIASIPPLILNGTSFSQWIYRALVFLVVSCPCALVISIPLSFFGGIGGASRSGILVKGGNYLEALTKAEIVIFDKTGTLTKGVFKVTDIKPKNNITKKELLQYAALAESYSNHPIAISILKAYDKPINKSEIKNYKEILGQGVKVKLKDKEIIVGNSKMMIKQNIAYDKIEAVGTIIYVVMNKQYIGYIVISDEIKEDAIQAIKSLKLVGITKTIMLTGDSKPVAIEVGKKLGLGEIYSELLPDQKVEKIEVFDKQKSPKGKLIFVGDGINDAPVLARADIGIAMGGIGSDAAIEAADIVIMTDEPSKIVSAIKIAKRTKSIVKENIIFALVVKIVILTLGAFGMATMWEAVFGDVGVALIAVLNAMRAMKIEKI
ncbi:heavy metal translocating P-type ATPase [Clostridium thailandense]|uniref:heavy metal translocating P-type ATPase n=1 Tax=Clostridium thailandense TaxID=2794346 RepID=UPI00398A0F39